MYEMHSTLSLKSGCDNVVVPQWTMFVINPSQAITKINLNAKSSFITYIPFARNLHTLESLTAL
jgi:hypothetical protein